MRTGVQDRRPRLSYTPVMAAPRRHLTIGSSARTIREQFAWFDAQAHRPLTSYQELLERHIRATAGTFEGFPVTPFDAESGSLAALDYKTPTAWNLETDRNMGLFSEKSRRGLVAAQARIELRVHVLTNAFVYYTRYFAKQVAGRIPLLGDDGTALTGQALLAKKIEIFNKYECLVSGAPQNAVAALLDELIPSDHQGLSSDVSEAKQQLFETLDERIDTRCRFLFGTREPSNQDQANARWAMRKARQTMADAFVTATTVAAAQTAFNTATATVDGVEVRWSPQFFHGSTHITTGAYSNDYTKGDTPWSLVLSARTTGTAADSHGTVRTELPASDDFQFAVARQSTSSITITITRKGDGHPAAGTYTLGFTVRNHNGASTITVSIVVT